MSQKVKRRNLRSATSSTTVPARSSSTPRSSARCGDLMKHAVAGGDCPHLRAARRCELQGHARACDQVPPLGIFGWLQLREPVHPLLKHRRCRTRCWRSGWPSTRRSSGGLGEAEDWLPALRNAKREHRDSAAARAERTQQCQRSTRGSRECSWRSRQRTTASASFSLCKRKSTSMRLQREAVHPRRVRTQERRDTERPA
ncbi:hypothetical protein M9Y10_020579 [Tritrichomonas musculus]|uniref:Uncharacterized protein n=1 Tax=Tritrichomonas musculus TaxID=1915356 RepID=A0ABR2GKD2_9EUKA